MKNEQALRAGAAFAKRVADDPELQVRLKTVQGKLSAIGEALERRHYALLAIDEVIKRWSREAIDKIHDAERQRFDDLAAQIRKEFEKHDREWAEKYGEPPPRSMDEYDRWAARVGLSGERIMEGDYAPSDLFPLIEGHLLRLRDLQREHSVGEVTNGPQEAAIRIVVSSSPPQVILDGQYPIALTADEVACLTCMLDKGDWISSREIGAETEIARADRVVANLRDVKLNQYGVIETRQHGSRVKPEWLA